MRWTVIMHGDRTCVTLSTASRVLGVSTATVWRWLRSGKLIGIHMPGRPEVLIPVSDLMASFPEAARWWQSVVRGARKGAAAQHLSTEQW